MIREATHTPSKARQKHRSPDIHVLVIYEDLITGLRGATLTNALREILPLEPKFSTSLWQWQLLREPGFSDQAAAEAADAEFIILAGHGNEELPRELRHWVDRWLGQTNHRPIAVGLLLDQTKNLEVKENPVFNYLSAKFAAASVDLFTDFVSLQALVSSLKPKTAGGQSNPSFTWLDRPWLQDASKKTEQGCPLSH